MHKHRLQKMYFCSKKLRFVSFFVELQNENDFFKATFLLFTKINQDQKLILILLFRLCNNKDPFAQTLLATLEKIVLFTCILSRICFHILLSLRPNKQLCTQFCNLGVKMRVWQWVLLVFAAQSCHQVVFHYYCCLNHIEV